MPHVFTHPRAEADPVDIWRYIAQDSPANADRMLDRINDTMIPTGSRALHGAGPR
jgi:plasmid stabilization system protein ParE